MEQGCAEITLDTICSLAGINQRACVMFLTLNPADMEILHCSGLPTSAGQANKAQKRQMSITRDKGKKNHRHKKVRAHQSSGDRRSLAQLGQLWPQCSPGDRTRNGCTFAFMQLPSISCQPRPHSSSRSCPELRENPAQTCPGAGERGVPVQPARRTNPDPRNPAPLIVPFAFHSRWSRVALKEKEKKVLTNGINE